MNTFLDSLGAFSGPTMASILLTTVIVCAAYVYQTLLQKLPANMRPQIEALAGIVVQAIEQQFSDGTVAGRQKKQEAMYLLGEICQGLHFSVDTKHASAAIEAAVYSLNQQKNRRLSAQPTVVTPSVGNPPPPSGRYKLN